jgi:hypothetical protein
MSFVLQPLWTASIVAATLAGLGPAGPADDTLDPVWSVEVRPLGVADRMSDWYWVGLRNGGSSERVLCMGDIRYEWTRGDGVDGAAVAVGSPRLVSPHYCADRSLRHLVLPGQTYFAAVGVEAGVTQGANPSAFVVGAIELCAEKEPCKDRAFTLRARVPPGPPQSKGSP